MRSDGNGRIIRIDLSKDSLNALTEIPQMTISKTYPNRVKKLMELMKIFKLEF